MRIEHVEEFLDLAVTLNFTRTAKHFYITQPVLSKHIAGLEAELGSRLFNRDKTGIKDAGNFNSCYAAEDGTNLHLANRNKNGWTRLWRSYAFAVPACCKCPDFWCVEADISVKDAWGKKEWIADPLGKSVVIIRSEEMRNAFAACAFETSPLETPEVAQMQKPQLVYKLDEAETKLKRSVLSPANIRNGHFRQVLTAWLTRWTYAHFGPFATAVVFKVLTIASSGGRKRKMPQHKNPA